MNPLATASEADVVRRYLVRHRRADRRPPAPGALVPGLVRTAGRRGTVVQQAARRTGLGHSDLADAADALALVVRRLGLADEAAHRAPDSASGGGGHRTAPGSALRRR